MGVVDSTIYHERIGLSYIAYRCAGVISQGLHAGTLGCVRGREERRDIRSLTRALFGPGTNAPQGLGRDQPAGVSRASVVQRLNQASDIYHLRCAFTHGLSGAGEEYQGH